VCSGLDADFLPKKYHLDENSPDKFDQTMNMFLIYSVLSLSYLLQSQISESRSPEEVQASKAINRVQQLPAKNLDPKLSSQSFASWLKSLLGPGAALKWEVNDCGEQTGDPKLDAGRDIPACVEVDGENPHGDAKVVVLIALGSVNKGMAGRPQLWFASIEFPNRLLIPDQLHCLPAILNDPAYRSPGGLLHRQSGCKITKGKK
jgi:hypothetical protein